MKKSKDNNKIKKHLSSFQVIIISFMALVLAGALLLMLPISSKARVFTPFNEALFTATSASCVTGLIVHDTATYWSIFGQAVILILIQIGGLGVITTAASITIVLGKRVSLKQRSAMKDAMDAPMMGGIVKLTGFILRGSFIIEGAGMLIMLPSFVKNFGAKGIWMSLFHSVSAFCNAGFDIMGSESGKFSSLTFFAENPAVNITVMLLIIIGGIGFLTWNDICTNRFKFRRYRLQTKVILLTSAILIFVPAIYFFIFDFYNLPLNKRIWASLFQSVTARTAGFNTVNLNEMTSGGKAIMSTLMLIGGSPGSTAGGMKTTTVAVLAAIALSLMKHKDEASLFRRRIDKSIVSNAVTILVMYLGLFSGSALIISTIEGIPMTVCAYETASAVGTVGLTLGITSSLGLISRLIIISLMFFGRVGGLTLIYATIYDKTKAKAKYPVEKITVG